MGRPVPFLDNRRIDIGNLFGAATIAHETSQKLYAIVEEIYDRGKHDAGTPDPRDIEIAHKQGYELGLAKGYAVQTKEYSRGYEDGYAAGKLVAAKEPELPLIDTAQDFVTAWHNHVLVRAEIGGVANILKVRVTDVRVASDAPRRFIITVRTLNGAEYDLVRPF